MPDYEYVFLDCPPSISLVSESVFEAADALIIPLLPAALSARTLDRIDEVVGRGTRRLAFFSMVDTRKRMHRDVMAQFAAERPERCSSTVVPMAADVERMGQARAPLEEFAPHGRAAVAFRELWEEIRERLGRSADPRPDGVGWPHGRRAERGPLTGSSQSRPEPHPSSRRMNFAELHFHLLPGIDDGPSSMEESVALAAAAAAEGTRTVVATPHIHPSFVTDPGTLAARVREVQNRLTAERIPIKVRCGGELDLAMPERLSDAQLEAIAHGPHGRRWVLLEAPLRGLEDDYTVVADELRERGFAVVVAHPERSFNRPEAAWRAVEHELAAGSALQINAWSVAGLYGETRPRQRAWRCCAARRAPCRLRRARRREDAGARPRRSTRSAVRGVDGPGPADELGSARAARARARGRARRARLSALTRLTPPREAGRGCAPPAAT